MIIDIASNNECLRDLLVSKANDKFHPGLTWFGPLCYGWKSQEEMSEILAERRERCKNLAEALDAIDALLEKLEN